MIKIRIEKYTDVTSHTEYSLIKEYEDGDTEILITSPAYEFIKVMFDKTLTLGDWSKTEVVIEAVIKNTEKQ